MKRKIAAIALLCMSVYAYAQDSTSARLTFKEAVKIGLDNNLVLNQQKNLSVSSRVAKSAGLLSFGPTVAINGNVGRNDGNSFNQQEGRVINGVLDFTAASLDAEMPLFRGLNVLNSYRAANSAYDAQLHNVNRTQQDVIRDVSRQYLTCLLDQRLVLINTKNLEYQQQLASQISEQVNAGARAEVDLKNQEYQVKNANLLLVRAKNTLTNDKSLLAQTLQLDPTIPFELQDPEWEINDLSNLTLEELNTIATERRSDLKRAEQTEKASLFTFQATKGGYFPSITAFGSYGSRYNYIHASSALPDPDNREFDQQFYEDNTQLTYGISFRIPIYNALVTRANSVRSKMLYENAKLQTENTQIVVKSEVILAHQNLRDAETAFEAATAQLEAAKVSNDLERERYNLGISDIVTLNLSNQTLIRAQGDYESARYTLMFQKLYVNYATGTLTFEDIP
jgi:outer membrane protein